MKNERLTFLLAMFVAISISLFSYSYLSFKEQNENARKTNFAFESFESLDAKYSDLKYKLRDQTIPKSKVALIAIDDESIQEVGRWPWNRSIMAQITKNLVDLGASAVGFDIVQSEPDLDHPERDADLAKVVTDHSDKIVLGAFGDPMGPVLPYQDYCVAQAFRKNGGEQIVKLTPLISAEGPEDSLETVRWNDLFEDLFGNYFRTVEIEYLKSLNKNSTADLTEFQKKYFESNRIKEYYKFCQRWLTEEDPFDWKKFDLPKKFYTEQLSKNAAFANLDLGASIAMIQKSPLMNIVPQNSDWVANIPDIQNGSLYTASFNTYLDPDGYVRKYPLFFRSGQNLGLSFVPALAFQTYLVAKNYQATLKFESATKMKSLKEIFQMGAKQQIKRVQSILVSNPQTDPATVIAELPVDQMGRLPVNYYGPQESVPRISVRELLNPDDNISVISKIWDQKSGEYLTQRVAVSKKEFFKDRAVIVGATAVGIYDLRNTPIEANFPGPEIHATMLANLLDNNILHRPKNETRYLAWVILAIGIALSLAWAHIEALYSALLFVVILFGTFGFDFFLFSKRSVLTTNLLLLTEIISIYSLVTIFKYFTEERKKKELKSTFSKYVSPAIVDEVLKQPENLKLGGRKQRMSVFFSDVRGFTTISEKLPPQELAQLLNNYLTPMTELVFKNKGTLDKYMGDAIMAFFGAPIFFENHAQMACRCALENLEKLAELQLEFAAKNLPRIDIGIGINTGEMSVGNMGSNIVQNYTVMGDSVNLASRLEGINKEYGTRIIISEFTHHDVKDLFVCREVDRVRVKGKNEPVRIFELIKEGKRSASEQEWLSAYEKACELYFSKNFKDAESGFRQCLLLNQNDTVSELYIKRCTDYQNDPPPADWDGVYVMKTK